MRPSVVQHSWIPALVEIARIHSHNHDWDRARETISHLQSFKYSCIGLRAILSFLISTEQYNEGKVAEVMVAFSDMLRKYEPDNSEYYYDTSRILVRLSGRRKGLVKAALRLVDRASKLSPTNAAYLVELAKQHTMLYDYDTALDIYRIAAKFDETNLDALFGMLYCQIARDDLEDTDQQLRILSSVSDSVEARIQSTFLSALVAWQVAGDASEHFRLLLETKALVLKYKIGDSNFFKSPSHQSLKDADFLMLLAKEFLRHGTCEDYDLRSCRSSRKEFPAVENGIRLLKEVIIHVPGFIEARLLIAHSHYILCHYDLAEMEIEQVLMLDTQCAHAYLLKARISLRQRNEQQASQALQEALLYDFEVRNTAMYLAVKSQLHINSGEYSEALKLLNFGLDLPVVRSREHGNFISNCVLQAERASIYILCAQAYSFLGQFKEAETVLSEALKIFKGRAEEAGILTAMSNVAIQQDDVENGIQILSYTPKHPSARLPVLTARAEIILKTKRDKRSFIACYEDLIKIQSAADFERNISVYSARVLRRLSSYRSRRRLHANSVT